MPCCSHRVNHVSLIGDGMRAFGLTPEGLKKTPRRQELSNHHDDVTMKALRELSEASWECLVDTPY